MKNAGRQLYDGFGESKTLNAWSLDKRCLLSRKGLLKRLQKGESIEEAFSRPRSVQGSVTGANGVLHEAFGESKTMNAWAADPRCLVSRTMLRKRIAAGVPMELALQKEPSRTPLFGQREAFGEWKTLAEWARDPRCVVSYQQLLIRLATMTLEEALTTPTAVKRDDGAAHYEAFGENKSLASWVVDPRCPVINPATLHARIHRLGMDVETAISHVRFERSSVAEEQLAAFIRLLGVEVQPRFRGLIHPQEVDMYIPEKKIAIEYNGIYWHSERHLDQSYHWRKWRNCADRGVQLVQVWQDDFTFRRPIVERMLRHKLGCSDEPRLYARKLEVTVESKVAHFLTENHIQGPAGGTVHIGLRHEDELVAICSFLQTGISGAWVLTRYATSQNVVGGFTKCLSHFCRSREWSSIATFSDHCVSDGSLYRMSGFSIDKEIPPDYSYLVDGHRVHKFNYRLARFKSDPNLAFEEGRTERELAEMNGLPRIWDAGKTRWVLRA